MKTIELSEMDINGYLRALDEAFPVLAHPSVDRIYGLMNLGYLGDLYIKLSAALTKNN